MKIDLLKIESKLKDFFEKDLQIVAHKDPLQNITEEMISALGKNIRRSGGRVYAPNIFRISIKDKSLLNDKDLKEWKNNIAEIIKDIVRDNSFQLAGPLHIQFFHNTDIKDDFEISVSNSSISSGKTINLFSKIKNRNQSEKIMDGYLITADEAYHQITKMITNIGRREDNDLVIDNLRVSRIHAQIRQINLKHVLFDLDSTTGTKVNGVKIRQHALKHGDVIEIADVPIIYGTSADNIENEEYKSKTKLLTPQKELKSKQ